jgi:hypothetical protein
MSEEDFSFVGAHLFNDSEQTIPKYPNVVGWSLKPRRRIAHGVTLEGDDELVIRVYVVKKYPAVTLGPENTIPDEIQGIKVDVVEIGPHYAHEVEEISPHRQRHRPLVPGTSIGNWGITAGTHGWYSVKDGEIFIDSNAHVLADFPNLGIAIEKRIVAPGKADGGNVAEDQVGLYHWHDQINAPEPPPIPTPPPKPGCKVTRGIEWALNGIYGVVGRTSRWQAYTPTMAHAGVGGPIAAPNYQDFAVATIDDGIEYSLNTLDFDVTPSDKFVGHIFAGGFWTAIVCKVKYQVESGYTPYAVEVHDEETDPLIPRDTKLKKSGRTTGFREKSVFDDSAVMSVGYGDFTARFEDVCLVWQTFSNPGDSGSGVFLA